MVQSFTLLLFLQLAGEICSRLFRLPIPGPVLGMVLLLLVLVRSGSVAPALRSTSLGLLENLSLLFVPAGVGVMVHFSRLSGELVPIMVALFASTVLTVAATALTLVLLTRRRPIGGARQ